jgi:hypothetical protein
MSNREIRALGLLSERQERYRRRVTTRQRQERENEQTARERVIARREEYQRLPHEQRRYEIRQERIRKREEEEREEEAKRRRLAEAIAEGDLGGIEEERIELEQETANPSSPVSIPQRGERIRATNRTIGADAPTDGVGRLTALSVIRRDFQGIHNPGEWQGYFNDARWNDTLTWGEREPDFNLAPEGSAFFPNNLVTVNPCM